MLTHHTDDEPPGATTFHSDVLGCAASARAAAVGAARALLDAGQLDELEIHLVPVLLGAGRRLFESRTPVAVELELVRRLEGRDTTHLRYRIRQ